MNPTQLPTRPLGKNGPQVTRLGLGLMGISCFYGNAKPELSRMALLDAAYKLGEDFWDTGKWATPQPDQPIAVSKLYIDTNTL